MTGWKGAQGWEGPRQVSCPQKVGNAQERGGWVLSRPEDTTLGLSEQPWLLSTCFLPGLFRPGPQALGPLVCENLGCGFLLVEAASSPHSAVPGLPGHPEFPTTFSSPLCHHPQR